MRYDIYFHNDFDGRASAAIMLAFLRSRGDDFAHYHCMNYGEEKPWFKVDLSRKPNPAIVVDFTYHPKATWWFDHHATGFKKPEWQKKFKPDTQHRLEPDYASCSHLVFDSLKKDFSWKPPKYIADLAHWLDIIDGAKYRSARQTIEMKESAIQMNAYIEGIRHTPKENAYMVQLLAARPLAEVIKDPMIDRGINAIKKKAALSRAFYKKNLQIFERSTFIDLSKDPLNGLMRFLPWYLHPESIYNIRMRAKGKYWYLGVAVNPWRRTANKLDVGILMRRYGGGGHYTVGATEFKTRAAALAAFREINALLNR